MEEIVSLVVDMVATIIGFFSKLIAKAIKMITRFLNLKGRKNGKHYRAYRRKYRRNL